MSDTQGKLRIKYSTNNTNDISSITLDFGSITSITPSFNKALSTIPLLSMRTDRTFQLETGNTLQYNISFKRKNPTEQNESSSDTTMWSNAHWYREVTKLVDRWQMRTDGCTLIYDPDVTNPYVPVINVNGYIKMLSRKFSNRYNELIEGTIQFIVGTMYVLSSKTPSQPESIRYRTIVLKPVSGVVNTDPSNEDIIKYGLMDVYLQMDTQSSTLVLPDMPSIWNTYSLYNNNKTLLVWRIGSQTSEEFLDNTIGKGVDVGTGDELIELRAVWS